MSSEAAYSAMTVYIMSDAKLHIFNKFTALKKGINCSKIQNEIIGGVHAYGYDECIKPKDFRNHEPHEHPGDQQKYAGTDSGRNLCGYINNTK